MRHLLSAFNSALATMLVRAPALPAQPVLEEVSEGASQAPPTYER
jgi:hypothetical protein